MLRLLILSGLGLIAASAPAAELVFDFGQNQVDQTPAGFRSTVSGQGKPGTWKIVMDAVPPFLAPLTLNAAAVSQHAVLAQLARDPTDEHFPLLIYEKETFGDFTLTTRLKTVSGAVEEMAGIAFRIKDERNYYVVRVSSLGSTFRFYKVFNGERGAPIGVEREIPRGTWHDLSIACKANQIRLLLDGKELIPTLTDNSFLAGKVGFWTKSDSVSYFADTRIVYTPQIAPAQLMVRDLLQKYPRLLGLKVFATNSSTPDLRLIASNDEKEVGQAGDKVEKDVVARDVVYCGREPKLVTVTMPLHDRNGDTVAAVRVELSPFAGQTEDNAVARALPIVKQLQARIRSAKDLLE
ncbi:MAG: family 16 glycoside hydrolase [Limisphaerales bacterium]